VKNKFKAVDSSLAQIRKTSLRKSTSKKSPVTIPSQNVPALPQWWRTDIRVEHVHLHEGRQAILCAIIRAPKIET
jgi:hypothetical protein